MKLYFPKTFLFAFTLIALQAANAQTDSAQKEAETFKISLNYNSNLNYFGRTDSLQSSGFFPMAELWLSPQFYINAAPVFVSNAVQKLDYAGTVATAGYQYLTDKWFSHLYVMKPFYKESSSLVQSALKAQSGVSISNLNKVVNITLGADVKWSDAVDYGATAGLDHAFRVEDKNGIVFVINPSVYAYAGTQRFSQTYTRRKKGGLLLPGREETVTENYSRFKILAYEASVPLIMAKGSWQLIATPAYVLPQNLLQVPGQPQLSERGSPTFYVTLGAKFAF
ncbi:MAG: hypothetical protein ACO1NX_01025 [Chitinophagaceae bacterium]